MCNRQRHIQIVDVCGARCWYSKRICRNFDQDVRVRRTLFGTHILKGEVPIAIIYAYVIFGIHM